jgi:hypothetical protein
MKELVKCQARLRSYFVCTLGWLVLSSFGCARDSDNSGLDSNRQAQSNFPILTGLQAADPAWADETLDIRDLTVEDYCTLTLQRLELTKNNWEENDRGPTPEEDLAICQRFGTTPAAYLAFAGAHAGEVEEYLGAHPEIQEQVDLLGGRINDIIQSKESQ